MQLAASFAQPAACDRFFPALYGVGLLSMLLNRDFKRLGDIAAGTVVVIATRPYVTLRYRWHRQCPTSPLVTARTTRCSISLRGPATLPSSVLRNLRRLHRT